MRKPNKNNAAAYLNAVAARLIKLTEEAYPDLQDRDSLPEPPGVTDDDRLAMVAMAFCQLYGLTPSFALDSVRRNRRHVLAAAKSGSTPQEIAQFVWETYGPPPS